MPISVLVVNAWDGASGVLTVINSLAAELKGEGVSYSSFCFNPWADDSPWRSCCNNLYDPRTTALAELLLRQQFDVVHLVDTACAPAFGPRRHLDRAGFLGGVLCMSQNSTPAISTPPRADVYVACSEASGKVMSRTVHDAIRIIPNAVDVARFRPCEPTAPARRPLIAWIGRASDQEQKDLPGFLNLVARHWNSELDFVVVDADQNANPQCCEWLAGRVQYVARQPVASLLDIYAQVRTSGGAVVSTSRFEGMSLALLEAAACGCLVIAPRVPGTEYLVHRETAYLYERHAGIEGISNCLQMLADTVRSRRVAATALALVQKEHDVRHMATQYLEAYGDCMSAAKTRSAEWRIRPKAWNLAYTIRRVIHRPAKRWFA